MIAVHVECPPQVVEQADYVGGTSGIAKFARESKTSKIIIGAEMGLIYRLKRENPGKQFFLLSPGLICPNMKATNLEKIRQALVNMEPRITVPEKIRKQAFKALEKMLTIIPN